MMKTKLMLLLTTSEISVKKHPFPLTNVYRLDTDILIVAPPATFPPAFSVNVRPIFNIIIKYP